MEKGTGNLKGLGVGGRKMLKWVLQKWIWVY